MNYKKISVVAKELGVTTQAVYKKLAKLGNEIASELIKDKGVTKVSPTGMRILEESLGKVSEKVETKDATVGNLVATLQKTIDEKQDIILNQQTMIQQLLEKQGEERQRTDSIIMKLAHDLEGTRKAALAIEAKVNSLAEKKETKIESVLQEKPQPVRPWTPKIIEDPLAGMTWLEKLWSQIAHPEGCRRVTN